MRKPQKAEQKYKDVVNKWEGNNKNKIVLDGQCTNVRRSQKEKTKAGNSVEINKISKN